MTAIDHGRALLFCPGDRPDRFLRAATCADAVILDLEDGVGVAAKDDAREAVARSLTDGTVNPDKCIVRINPLETKLGRDDVARLRDTPLKTVMLPKAEAADVVESLAPWSAVVLCESAAGVLAAPELAATTNCVGLMWGGEDLTADLGGRSSRGRSGSYLPLVTHARVAILLAAGAAGRAALDGVYLDIPDVDGLRAEAEEAVSMGFSAKVAIHPSQVPWIRKAFSPTVTQLAWVRDVVAELEGSSGVSTVQGQMIDEPLLRQAQAILAAQTQVAHEQEGD